MLLLVLTMLLQAKAPAVRTIERGTQSFQETAKTAMARTPAEWAALWKTHAPERPLPAVDFAKEMVVAVFMGTRPTAGYGVEIVGTVERNGGVVVQYVETQPAGRAVTAQLITMPYHFAAVPKTAATVTFEKIEKTAK
jgi:hypothetical protein